MNESNRAPELFERSRGERMPVAPCIAHGRFVSVSPLKMEDVTELYEATPHETFHYFALGRPQNSSREEFDQFVEHALFSANAIPHTIRLRSTGQIVGCSSYLDIKQQDWTLEIGRTWYAPDARGTAVNPESKLLLLAHAFDTLGCVRVQIKTDERNELSRRAILGIGATFEGILRRHLRLDDGTFRNTAYYSILDTEWPQVQSLLQTRLESFETGA